MGMRLDGSGSGTRAAGELVSLQAESVDIGSFHANHLLHQRA